MDIHFVNKVVKYNKECPSVHYWTIYYALQALGHPWPYWRAFLFYYMLFVHV